MNRILFLLLTVLIMLPSEALSAAFFIYNQDAKANGMGMAAVCSSDNASAVFYNPANLVYDQGLAVSAGDTLIMPSTYFEDPQTGKRTYTKSQTHHLPAFFAKHTTDNLAFGLGVFSPFGLSTEWPKGWVGRYTNYFAEIKTTFVNPTIAYKANDFISFGLGITFVKSSVKFKQALAVQGLPDGNARLSGDGDGIGINGGVTLKLPQQYTLSFTYRSPVKIKYDGKTDFALPSPLPASSTGASTEITLPFIAVGGIAKKMGGLTVEADLILTGWSSFDSYTVTFDNGMSDQVNYKGWSNTWSVAAGANYEVNKSFELRGGYMYDQSPVPKKTLGPELPDSTRNIFTVGASYIKERFRGDITYQATFFQSSSSLRSMTDPKGTYENFAHVILLTLTYRYN